MIHSAVSRLSFRGLLVAGLAIALSACQPATTIKPTGATSAADQTQQLDINATLALARSSLSPAREQLYLQVAEALNQTGETAWARNILADLDTSALNDKDFLEYTLLFSDIALADDSMFLAQRILSNPRLEQHWQSMLPDQEAVLRERRALVFATLGEAIDSIKERLTLTPMLVDENQESHNREALWQTLMTLPDTQLKALSEKETNETLRGWYSLAALNKNNQADLEEQLKQVYQWRQQWPQHPASQQLPKDLKLLDTLVAERPQRIALLLPTSGPLAEAGQAIRDGFMAAYYEALKHNNATPTLQVYDTNNADINTLYDQAVNAGANLVIGPLDKDKVADLNLRLELPVPVIALNYIDVTPVTTTQNTAENPTAVTNEAIYAKGLYQFGLSADDEARQAATRAWLDTYRNTMIIAPDSNWGQRTANAFAERWQEYGGTVVSRAFFTSQNDFSRVIKASVGVEQSEQRATELRRLFGPGFPLEFEPRRRQDIDMIFLVARPSEARQLKPMLAFHYAGDIPVYATSHIYSGTPDRGSDSDINGIKFNTLPWYFNPSNPEKRNIDKYAQAKPEYQSLYALGVDIFQIYPRLKQLEAVPETRIYGATGALHLTPDRKIHREQLWAQIIGGVARAMPMVVSQN